MFNPSSMPVTRRYINLYNPKKKVLVREKREELERQREKKLIINMRSSRCISFDLNSVIRKYTCSILNQLITVSSLANKNKDIKSFECPTKNMKQSTESLFHSKMHIQNIYYILY